jgi:hypothetical protein
MALSKQLQRIHEAIMTIKQYGGVFGRNPTFNDVTIEGQLTFDGDIDINSDLKVSGDIETTGNVIIATSGKGIDFSATAGTGTSELLDDYEEGTWTPVVTANVGSITTYAASGKYTKIGRLLTLQFTIVITDNGTGSGAMFVDGVPFAASNTSSEAGCGREEASTGISLAVGIRATTQLIVNTYSGSYPGVNGYRLDCSITYTV